MAAKTAVRVGPSNGGHPSTAVYRVAPSAHRSTGAWMDSPSICSGAMYCGVPMSVSRGGQLGGGVEEASDAEVGEHRAAPGQQHVGGLEVAVDDPGRVRVREGVRQVRAERGDLLPGQAPSRAMTCGSEGPETNSMTIHGTPSTWTAS